MISRTSAIWRRPQIVTQFTSGIAIAFLGAHTPLQQPELRPTNTLLVHLPHELGVN
jgi:hypothetical protein